MADRGYLPIIFILPLIATILGGLLFSLLPAFGYFPALGGKDFSLEAWRALLAMPGIRQSLAISFLSGFGATAIAVLLAMGLLALGGSLQPILIRLCGLVLATPHAALAIGLGFLIAPSGWLIRLWDFCCWDLSQMPVFQAPQDSLGLSLALALVVKETPFLVLVGVVSLRQIDAQRYLLIAESLGYTPLMAWLKIVLPLLYRQMRLPIFAVLAYSLSVVDMSIILGPAAPPSFILRILQWSNDPDLSMRFVAASGALLQTFFVLACLILWQGMIFLLGWIAHPFLSDGRRALKRFISVPVSFVLILSGFVSAFLAIGSLFSLFFWSLAGSWIYPAPFPKIDLWAWMARLDLIPRTLGTSLWVAILAVGIALCLVLMCLEFGRREKGLWLIYAPLIIPEFLFIFGVAVILIALHLDGNIEAVVWSHILFIFPYLYLALADAWHHLDPRYIRTASSLGSGRWRVFFKVKLPLLRGPICNAAAIGFAVSLSLYLPTLLTGAGRISTLATEAIQLASAGDRRVTAMFALMQCLFVWLAFLLAHRLGRPRSFSR